MRIQCGLKRTHKAYTQYTHALATHKHRYTQLLLSQLTHTHTYTPTHQVRTHRSTQPIAHTHTRPEVEVAPPREASPQGPPTKGRAESRASQPVVLGARMLGNALTFYLMKTDTQL